MRLRQAFAHVGEERLHGAALEEERDLLAADEVTDLLVAGFRDTADLRTLVAAQLADALSVLRRARRDGVTTGG